MFLSSISSFITWHAISVDLYVKSGTEGNSTFVSNSSRSFLMSSLSTRTSFIPSRFCCRSASFRRTSSSFVFAAFLADSRSFRQSRSSLATLSLSAASFASSFCLLSVSAPSDNAFLSCSRSLDSSSSCFFLSASAFAFSVSFSRRRSA